MISRVLTVLFAMVVIVGPGSAAASSKTKLLPAIEPNEEGVYVQPWFYESFLNIREDINDSAKEGKQLVILWEQRGCPYCREMHHVNLRRPEIVDYIRENFNVVQLNLWSDREVTDVDGEITTEKKLARKYRVQFTPTIQFFHPPWTITQRLPATIQRSGDYWVIGSPFIS